MTRIVCAGVAVLDFVLSVDEIPSAARKYRANRASIVGGGVAANAAVAVARLGGEAVFVGELGSDPVGDLIVAGLEGEGVDCSWVRRRDDLRSSFSSVAVDPAGERQIVNFRDMASPTHAIGIPDAFHAALADTRWPAGAKALMAAARAAGVPGIIDAEPPVAVAAEALALASHIAFSSQGLEDHAGRGGAEGLRIARKSTRAWMCVTEGERGVLTLEGDAAVRTHAFEVEVADTLGAGDVWHGAFALALGEGRGEAGAIRFANAAAAIKCTRTGGRAGTPTRDEVENFLRRNR